MWLLRLVSELRERSKQLICEQSEPSHKYSLRVAERALWLVDDNTQCAAAGLSTAPGVGPLLINMHGVNSVETNTPLDALSAELEGENFPLR